ncbi:hypothetical protein [Alteromonas ponticola]|uniref:Uncharacterized protein n=1 Tax=Alteromonas ponticola TaxID=2720613 RepID=A0ABX1R4U8_9ALTE|nr:hypothetical protein [Alteromonas ponticola]NMH60283.1 hypothetical protein [Alteromonas ponticola]
MTMILFGLASSSAFAQPDNLSAALTDIAAAKICERLQDRFRGLRGQKVNGESHYTGTLWIHSCKVREHQKQHNVSTMHLGVKGWRWIDREKHKLGAGFNVHDYARFAVDVELTGALSAAYTPAEKKLAIWFQPDGKPKVNFNNIDNIEVEKEGPWASILSGAGALIGNDAEALASEKIASVGEERFTQTLSEGFSASVDFCTGRVHSELGQIEKTTLFSKLEQKQKNEFKSVKLEPLSFLLFGPYGERSSMLDLQIEMKNPATFSHKLICMDDAIKLADAYMKGDGSFPAVNDQQLALKKGEQQDSLRNANQTCPVVAMFATDESVEQSKYFKFRVRDYNDASPLIQCKTN